VKVSVCGHSGKSPFADMQVWFHVYVRLRWRHWRSGGEACDWDCPWCPNPPYEDRRIDVHAAEAAHLDWLRSRGLGVDGQPMRPGHNCPEWWGRP